MIKSKAFALEVIHACKELKAAKCEGALINQFLRSGTSIGANIREAFYAHGKADFIAKLKISLKECSETEYWSVYMFSIRRFLAEPLGMNGPSVNWFMRSTTDIVRWNSCINTPISTAE